MFMPKKKSTRSRAGATGGGPSAAASLSKQVSRLDRELVRLLNERATAAQQAARLCADPASAIPDFVMEEQAVDKAVAAHQGPLGERAIRAVFRELLSGTRLLLREIRVVYLGPEYSYSHIAAVEQFGTSAELVPVSTIAAVFDALNRRQADFGLGSDREFHGRSRGRHVGHVCPSARADMW